jgi:hypothetical protein
MPSEPKGGPDVLREALERKLAEMELHDETGDPYDEGYMRAWQQFREALAAVPERDPAGWEWRAVNRHGQSVGFSVNESDAREWQEENPRGHVERRRKAGPWQRAETPSEGSEGV